MQGVRWYSLTYLSRGLFAEGGDLVGVAVGHPLEELLRVPCRCVKRAQKNGIVSKNTYESMLQNHQLWHVGYELRPDSTDVTYLDSIKVTFKSIFIIKIVLGTGLRKDPRVRYFERTQDIRGNSVPTKENTCVPPVRKRLKKITNSVCATTLKIVWPLTCYMFLEPSLQDEYETTAK